MTSCMMLQQQLQERLVDSLNQGRSASTAALLGASSLQQLAVVSHNTSYAHHLIKHATLSVH
jgi:hypothetical protein